LTQFLQLLELMLAMKSVDLFHSKR